MKPVIYYCPGCRRLIIRELRRAVPRYPSFCLRANKVVFIRKLKRQPVLDHG